MPHSQKNHLFLFTWGGDGVFLLEVSSQVTLIALCTWCWYRKSMLGLFAALMPLGQSEWVTEVLINGRRQYKPACQSTMELQTQVPTLWHFIKKLDYLGSTFIITCTANYLYNKAGRQKYNLRNINECHFQCSRTYIFHSDERKPMQNHQGSHVFTFQQTEPSVTKRELVSDLQLLHVKLLWEAPGHCKGEVGHSEHKKRTKWVPESISLWSWIKISW